MIKNLAKKAIKNYFNSNILFSSFVARQLSLKYNVLYRNLLPKIGGVSDGTIIDKSMLNLAGTEFQDKIKINDADILKKTSSVAGYIPFLRNNTNIVLYNFFSKNYGIRKQLLTRICLCKGKELIDTKWFLLPSNCVKRLYFKDWQNLDADYISVEAFHFRLPKNHGDHDGHFRFWGLFGDGSATVHSMPTPNFVFPPQSLRAHRRYIPLVSNLQNNTLVASFSSLYGKKIVEDKNDLLDYKNIKSPVGYVSLSEKTNVETTKSIWHESWDEDIPFNKAYYLQIIPFPPKFELDAVLVFSEAINKKENIIFHFFDINDNIVDKVEFEVTPETQIQISKIFDFKKYKLSYLAVEFTNINKSSVGRYINFTYLINGYIADSVHAHPVIGNDKLIRKKNISEMRNPGNQCLKFMHFLPLDKAESYVSIWGLKNNENAKLRFIFENGEEFVHNFELKATKISHILINKHDLKDYFPKNEHGIVQLECFSGNPHANLTSKVYGKNSVSVDHFTGG